MVWNRRKKLWDLPLTSGYVSLVSLMQGRTWCDGGAVWQYWKQVSDWISWWIQLKQLDLWVFTSSGSCLWHIWAMLKSVLRISMTSWDISLEMGGAVLSLSTSYPSPHLTARHFSSAVVSTDSPRSWRGQIHHWALRKTQTTALRLREENASVWLSDWGDVPHCRDLLMYLSMFSSPVTEIILCLWKLSVWWRDRCNIFLV